MEFWIFINVYHILFEKNILITYNFDTQWVTYICKIFHMQKGKKLDSATPGFASDRIDVAVEAVQSVLNVFFRPQPKFWRMPIVVIRRVCLSASFSTMTCFAWVEFTSNFTYRVIMTKARLISHLTFL